LRQSGGFFHGTFVFAGLAEYWAALAESNVPGVDPMKARCNADRAAQQAAHGIQCLRQFALLTGRGRSLVDALAAEVRVPDTRLQAPGRQSLLVSV
jgi:HEXXH motif-containing protein